jgi:hypothetical protein
LLVLDSENLAGCDIVGQIQRASFSKGRKPGVEGRKTKKNQASPSSIQRNPNKMEENPSKKDLDSLGFLRPIRAFSTGYAGFSQERVS